MMQIQLQTWGTELPIIECCTSMLLLTPNRLISGHAQITEPGKPQFEPCAEMVVGPGITQTQDSQGMLRGIGAELGRRDHVRYPLIRNRSGIFRGVDKILCFELGVGLYGGSRQGLNKGMQAYAKEASS